MWDGVGGFAHDIGDAVVADIGVVLVVEEAVEKSWIRVLVRVRLSAPAANWDAESEGEGTNMRGRSANLMRRSARLPSPRKAYLTGRGLCKAEAKIKARRHSGLRG